MRLLLPVAALALGFTAPHAQSAPPSNLLTNPQFAFHAFENHRLGDKASFTSHNVAFWNTDAWGDITVTRPSHVDPAVRPAYGNQGLVSIAPGKKLWQFATLPELGLSHGDHLSLVVGGYQPAAGTLRARVKVLKLDSEDGTWSPADFGFADKRTFPRHSRGELVVAASKEAQSDQVGAVELRVSDVEVVGRFHNENVSHSEDINTVAVQVEFENTGTANVWVWSPCLVKGTETTLSVREAADLPSRPMSPQYRYLPRTIQKLWKGEPIHILLMGSSIDRGSANPKMYPYDEDPASPAFKQPLAEGNFDGSKVGRPDLDGYIGWWQHYHDYAGRLRLELMRKFNLPVSKICLNFMACDGSCVGEAHSGLAEYCSLSLPPGEDTNGHPTGKTWQELYPELFTRPEGPRPDLVIFGSGANEKTDTPDEAAVFEGMIRWIQRHYPGTEFLFCQFQNFGSYTPNVGDLAALALRYQIPVMDYDMINDGLMRWCSRNAMVPSDGHPQAAAHYIWFKQLEKAFECWDPIEAGQAQLQLPERMHPNSYGWEGEMLTFDDRSPRLKNNRFIFEDTVTNCWGSAKEGPTKVYVDGKEVPSRGLNMGRNTRNSVQRVGNCRLGERHILEFAGTGAHLSAVDAKVCPRRQMIPVSSPRWNLEGAKVEAFASDWGAPYGSQQAVLQPGQAFTVNVLCSDLSVAYVDAAEGGMLRVLVDGVEKLVQATNVPFVDLDQKQHFLENRKGILGLGFGWHTVRLEATDRPVAVLGVYAYDARSNANQERRLVGEAFAGETISFTAPFRNRPWVSCSGGLTVSPEQVTAGQVTFGGTGRGTYEVVGE